MLYYIGYLRDCYTGMKGAWELGSIENFNYNYIQSSCPKRELPYFQARQCRQ